MMEYNQSTKELITKIKNNQLSQEELIICLDSKINYVVSNAIIMIVKLNLFDKSVADRLVRMIPKTDSRYHFFNGIALGHLALAALRLINKHSELAGYDNLDYLSEEEKEKVDYVTTFLESEALAYANG